jgi:hypothetical protein
VKKTKFKPEEFIFGMSPHIAFYIIDTFALKLDELTKSQKMVRLSSDYDKEINNVWSHDTVEYEGNIKDLYGHAGYFFKHFLSDYTETIDALNELGAKEYAFVLVEASSRFFEKYNTEGNQDIYKTLHILEKKFEVFDAQIRAFDHKMDEYINEYDNEDVIKDIEIYLQKYLKDRKDGVFDV